MLRALIIVLFCGPVLLSAASTEQEQWPDGARRAVYRLNRDGERHGAYTVFFPCGRQRQESGEYRLGQLHGVRAVFNEQGGLVAEETWFEGRLIFPASIRQINAMRQTLDQQARSYVAEMDRPSHPRAPNAQQLSQALARIRLYRFLVGVAYEDIGLRDDYLTLTQEAAEINEANGRLSHGPSRPDGWDDERFALGYKGAKESNLSMGRVGAAAIDAFMDDSDSSNISRLGHRRWVINPSQLNTGIGISGRYCAHYAFDRERREVPDYTFVAFPGPGYMPIDLFGTHYAWHISLNPDLYHRPTEPARLDIYPVGPGLTRGPEALEINYRNIDHGGFGINNAIIARPAQIRINRGATYMVVVSGLRPKRDDLETEISYVVSFF